jgi:hypothetical protein
VWGGEQQQELNTKFEEGRKNQLKSPIIAYLQENFSNEPH